MDILHKEYKTKMNNNFECHRAIALSMSRNIILEQLQWAVGGIGNAVLLVPLSILQEHLIEI